MDNEMSTVTELLLGGAILASALPRLASAADEEVPDGEFLEYLGTLEGEQEDWTWFSKDKESKQHPEEPPADETTPQDAH